MCTMLVFFCVLLIAVLEGSMYVASDLPIVDPPRTVPAKKIIMVIFLS